MLFSSFKKKFFDTINLKIRCNYSTSCKVDLIQGLTGSGKTHRSVLKCVDFYESENSTDVCIMACYSFQALIDVLDLFSEKASVSYDTLSKNLDKRVIIFNRHFDVGSVKYNSDIRVIFTTHSCINRSGDSPVLNEFMTYMLHMSLNVNLHLILDESLHFFHGMEWYFKVYYLSEDIEDEGIPVSYSYKLNAYNVYTFTDIVLKEDYEYKFSDFLYYIDHKPDHILNSGNSRYETYTNKRLDYRALFKKTKNRSVDDSCLDFKLYSVSDFDAEEAMHYFFKSSYQLVYTVIKGKLKNTSYISGINISVLRTYSTIFRSIDFVSSSFPLWVFDIFGDLNILFKYIRLSSKPVTDSGNIFLLNKEVPISFIKSLTEKKGLNSVLFCKDKNDLRFLVNKLRVMRCTGFQFFLEGIQNTSQVSNTYSKLHEPRKAPLWISHLSSRESKGVNIANINLIIVKVRLFMPVFFIPRDSWTNSKLRAFIWEKSFHEVFESVSRALRNYASDPEKIILFTGVKSDFKFIDKICSHFKFEKFKINSIKYALGYKNNQAFFFDYINNVYFGSSRSYSEYILSKRFIPTISKKTKKLLLGTQLSDYFKHLNKDLMLRNKFNLSNVYKFTLYCINITKEGVCIHWFNSNLIKYIHFNSSVSFFKKFKLFLEDITFLVGFNNYFYDDRLLSRLVFIFEKKLVFNFKDFVKSRLFYKLKFISYDLSGLFKGGMNYNPVRFITYPLEQIGLYCDYSLPNKMGFLRSNLTKLLLIYSIYSKNQSSFHQKWILLDKFRSYSTFILSKKKIDSFFFIRGDRLARILFNVLCINMKYSLPTAKKIISVSLDGILKHFEPTAGRCINEVKDFLRGKNIISINNSLHYLDKNKYVKLEKKVEMGNFFFNFKSGGLVINAGQVLKKDTDEYIGYFDFESFYPTILVNFSILPKFVTEFYVHILNLRLKAKNAGDLIVSDSLKLLINSFSGSLAMGGKSFKLKNSRWYHSMIFYGQLYLLKFIDFVTGEGCSVLGGKTDGVYISSSSKVKLGDILVRWNTDNHFLKVCLTHIKFLSVYNNKYLHLDFNNNFKADGLTSSNTSILNYNHNRILPYCIGILIKNYLLYGNVLLNKKKLFVRELKDWILQTKHLRGFLFFGNSIVKFIRWLPIKREFNIGNPLFFLNKWGEKKVVHPNVLNLSTLKPVIFSMIDVDYYLSLIKKTYNLNLFEVFNLNFESKVYKVYTKQDSKYILKLFINNFSLGGLEMPMWKKGRRAIIFFLSLSSNNDCKVSVSWNRGGTLYFKFHSKDDYGNLYFLSLLKSKFNMFKII